MIISRTPFRISFAGGGTDFADFYRKDGGEVVSTAIDKYIYVTINKRFDDSIRLSYTKTEIVEHFEQLQHGLVREAMRLTGVTSGVEITTIADIPAKGSGLGSSSSLTVGLLNAFYAYHGKTVPVKQLAQEACRIEIDILGEPIGKQDQYIAAYGGLKHFYFKPNDDVLVEPLIVRQERIARLQDNLMLFYTNITRDAGSIFRELKTRSQDNFSGLRDLKGLAGELKILLEDFGKDDDEFGRLLRRGWELKKRLAGGITNQTIEDCYQAALSAGALGGKILGAGGGGFLLLYCKKEHQDKAAKALASLRLLPFAFEPEGSRIIYADY